MGTIGVSYDEELDRVVLVLEEIDVENEEDEEDEVEESGHVLRVALRARAGRRLRHPRHAPGGVRAAGLPAVRTPLDPAGHNCPRTNGHRPPAS